MRAVLAATAAAFLAACGDSTPPPPPPPAPPTPAETAKKLAEDLVSPKPAAEPERPADHPEKPEPPSVASSSAHAKFMRRNEKEFELALKEAGKPDKVESVKARLQAIRENTKAFREAWTPKGHDPGATPEDDAATADILLDLFLLTLGQIENSDLGGEGGHDAVERLRLRCDTCHERFREPE